MTWFTGLVMAVVIIMFFVILEILYRIDRKRDEENAKRMTEEFVARWITNPQHNDPAPDLNNGEWTPRAYSLTEKNKGQN